MVRNIALRISIAAIMPSILANSSVAIINNQQTVNTAAQKIDYLDSSLTCRAKDLSTKCLVDSSERKTSIDSNLWTQKVTNLLLSRSLFSSCFGRSLHNTEIQDSLSDRWNGLSSEQLPSQKFAFPLSNKLTDSGCLGLRPKQLDRSLKKVKAVVPQNFSQSSLPNYSQRSLSPSATPQFPKLLRSSLIVKFPQENSSLVLKDTKLANPAPNTERIASPFGWRRRPYSNQLQFHQGIDYGAPYGSPVVAVGNGIVTRVVSGCADFGNLFCGNQLGNWIEIDHGNGAIATYGHLKNSSVVVEEGMKVRKNQNIAQVGSSGWSTGAHLDFRLEVNGKHEDPDKYVMTIDE